MIQVYIKQSAFARAFDFEDMRPFTDSEANDVLQRMTNDPLFNKLIAYLWPEMKKEEALEKAARVHNVMDFQLEFMHSAIRTIVSRTSDGLSSDGFENLDKNESYLFIGNHRDILLDSAILQILLVEHGLMTSEITFGNNLMEPGFITDFGRLNRMFTVQREGTSRELYDISRKLSAYIRHTIIDKKVSVWIAQRNGRTKDGNDQTQTGLLKMLNISGGENFLESFSQLKVIPVTISYEYEPCDSLKVQELYLSSHHSTYKKTPGEDINSIVTGIKENKGRIHFQVGTPIKNDLEKIDKNISENEKIKQLANLLDQRISADYKLWPANYIAADLLENTQKRNEKYDDSEKNIFLAYVHKKIAGLSGEEDVLYQLFLKMYATPCLKQEIRL